MAIKLVEGIKHACLVGGIPVERNGFEGRNFDRCVKELLTFLF